MNSVKNVFSIKDLENLSGIKAHTIRIWEKRYNVLEPMRSDTNIRSYDISNLQKLLNIVLLHNYGYKISKISELNPTQIISKVSEIVSEKNAKNHALVDFKIAMMNFDQQLFFKTYDDLLSEKSFKEVFYDVFVPLMEDLGFLWQTDTISPAHEHFITYLIKQKLLINTEKVQILEPIRTNEVFVLYLPLNEIHELGLMYLNYELLLKGYKTIYLGESIPISSLNDIKNYFDVIHFVAYLTVEPTTEALADYLKEVENVLLQNTNHKITFLGKQSQHIAPNQLVGNMSTYKCLTEFTSTI